MRYLKLMLLVATLAAAVWLALIVQENDALQHVLLGGGYFGIFVFSFINGFNIFLPVVSASFVPAFTSAGLDPYVLVVLISLGMTFADTIVFFLARAGRVHLSKLDGRVMKTLFAAEEREHWLPLVILAFWSIVIPVPSELILIPLGLLGYRAQQVIPIVFLGNIVFNAAIAFWSVSVFSLLAA